MLFFVILYQGVLHSYIVCSILKTWRTLGTLTRTWAPFDALKRFGLYL